MGAGPTCSRCNKELDNWVGNIMVDGCVFPEQIKGLHVLCKDCTRHLDNSSHGRDLHNIWELSWIRESPMSRLAVVLQDVITSEGDTRWDAEAVREVGFLVALTLSYDEARTFLRYLNPREWDYDGTYLNRLKAIYHLDIDD